MAKAKLVSLCFDDGSTEEFTLGEDGGDCGDYISVRDESSYTEILISLENLDAFCEALKAFRDEVTKPKMTGGEKVYRAAITAWGQSDEWEVLSESHRARYAREAELLGIKDDE